VKDRTDTSSPLRDAGPVRPHHDRLAAARAGMLVWMDAEEAAAFLNYPKGTFNSIAASGEIPRHKRGAGWRYKREELDEWLLAG
jgi:excisionase family DNA binding protein